MEIPLINLKEQFKGVKREVLKGITDILSEQRLVLGENCSLLEKAIARYVGVPYAISCANGTDALILSLMALGIKEGDEVITTPYTFFSTASSIALLGARPVFVDVEKRFMNIDPTGIEDAITERTKAIIVVHLFGRVCEMERITAIGKRYHIPVVEDMAQALGASKNAKMAGTFGDIAAVSFYPTKNLGGIGEGGMVITKKKALGELVRMLRVHGMDKRPYHHIRIGINSRLDEIKAYALLVKFRYLDEWNRKRAENALFYNRHLKGLPIILPEIEEDALHIFHLYVIRLKERDELQGYLKEKGINTGIYYPIPLHLQRCFGYLGYKKGAFPVAEEAASTSLALPIYPELKMKEKRYIIDTIKGFFSK